MASHSSTLAWKIPWMEEPSGLQSMGSLRVGHDSVTSLSLFTFMHWRRKRQPTPVFLPGESQGRGSLVGCCLWKVAKESWDTLSAAAAAAAATAAKSLQSCPTLCDPKDGSPPGSAVPGVLQARTLEWVAVFFSNG